MTAQKTAIIDLGTNTFNLLLVKITPKAYYIFHSEKLPVKIGEGGINHGFITEDAQKRAIQALEYYKKIIEKEKITKVYGFATSAFRNAKNGRKLKEILEGKTGFELNIISGDKEAEYIYEGVKTAIDIGGDYALIVDIGGGSVEFIIANRSEIVWKKSFDIGAQRLLDWFHYRDPIPDREMSQIFRFFEEQLKALDEEMAKYNPKSLIGSSGTFDTLSEIYQHKINRFTKGDEAESPLTIKGFEEIYQQILRLNREERLKIPGMIEMRVDMIVVASCLVKYLLDKFRLEHIRVSSHSLKEGMISILQKEMSGQNKVHATTN